MALVKGCIIALVMIVLPLILGMLVTRHFEEEYKSSVISSWISGIIIMFGIFQILAIPVSLLDGKFTLLVILWCVVTGITAVVSLCLNYKNIPYMIKGTLKRAKRAGILGLLAAMIILMQGCILAVFQHVDDDDARYVPSALAAVEKDTMFEENPMTGEYMYWNISETRKDMVSPWVLFWALLARLFMIHPAIVIHTIVPFFFIPASYCIMYMVAKELFSEDMNKIAVFMILLSVLNIYSGYSIYTAGAFLLFRIWQGKALFANIIIPFLLFMAFRLFKYGYKVTDYVILTLTSCAASLTTGMGISLMPLFIGLVALIYFVKHRSLKVALGLMASVLPCLFYGGIYVMGYKLFI